MSKIIFGFKNVFYPQRSLLASNFAYIVPSATKTWVRDARRGHVHVIWSQVGERHNLAIALC